MSKAVVVRTVLCVHAGGAWVLHGRSFLSGCEGCEVTRGNAAMAALVLLKH